MKKLLPALLVISGLVWFSCQKQSGFQTATLKTPVDQIVATDGNVDNFVEAADYEADLISMGEGSLTAYTPTKSALIGRNMFVNMFNRYLNFKLRYKNGVGPNITLTTTNGGFPKILTLDYGDSLALANGPRIKRDDHHYYFRT